MTQQKTSGPYVFLPRVRRQGEYFYRLCPTCHTEAAIGIYGDGALAALRYILNPEWECMQCQRNTEQARAARL